MRPTYEEYREQTHDTREGEWPRIEFNARQTGRTTRMMEAAKAASYAGNRVHIVVMTHEWARELRHTFRTHEWPNSVFFHTIRDCPFQLHKRKETEAKHYLMKIFVSHEAIEFDPIYSNILLELHRFDLPPETK